MLESQPKPGVPQLHFDSPYAQSLWTQYAVCLWRNNIVWWRSPQVARPFLIPVLVSSCASSMHASACVLGPPSQAIRCQEYERAVNAHPAAKAQDRMQYSFASLLP